MHRHTHPTTTSPVAARVPWTILVLLAVAQFMVVLDITVVNVALPSIGADLGFAAGDLQWVVTAYVLTTGGLLLLGGRAADLFGRRPVFFAGLVTFTAASLASGLASSPESLIAARAAQGVGAAMLSPAALSIITTTYSGEQRTTALATWGAIGAAGAAVGVLFGGMLTTWLSWEWVFFINVPVGAVTAVLGRHAIPVLARPAVRYAELDVVGAASVMAGLVAVVYAIDGAASNGWGSTRTLALLALGAALIAAFLRIERSAKRPLVPPTTWRIGSLVSSATMMLGATGLMVGAFFLTSLYLQGVLGASALETGLAFLPFALIIGVAAHVGSQALGRFGARALVVTGLLLTATGALALAFTPDQADYLPHILPGLLPLGFGVGFVLISVQVTAMADVTHEDAGLASGLMQTAHEVGAALGVAVLSAVATSGGAGFAAGFGDAFVVAAAIAAGLAGLALFTVPAVRPAAGARVAAH
jgi:EmrB/QacA subfamily drug resistance transporter